MLSACEVYRLRCSQGSRCNCVLMRRQVGDGIDRRNQSQHSARFPHARGELHVTLKKGPAPGCTRAQASCRDIVICNPRRNALLKEGI